MSLGSFTDYMAKYPKYTDWAGKGTISQIFGRGPDAPDAL